MISFIPPLSRNTVGVIVNKEAISMGLVHEHSVIQTWDHHFMVHNLIILNATRMQKHITAFLAQHNAHHARIIFVFAGDQVHESIETPSDKPKLLDNYSYDTIQLSADTWYTASLHKSIIFQYQLLAHMLQLQLVAITTAHLAHYYSLSHNEHSIKTLEEFHHCCAHATPQTIIQGLHRYEKFF
ncbi:MAG: hypothetical protein WC707_06025 [Candidatus Babeliaceae bacterium]|jgi:hypothetical protein